MLDNTILLATRVMKQLIRDRRTIGMIVIMPIVITLIFGYAIGGTVENVPVAIVLNDQGANITNPSTNTSFKIDLGQVIYSTLKTDSRVKLYNQTDFQQASKDVDNSKYTVAINIPANFSTYLVNQIINPTSSGSSDPQITVYVDATEPSLVASVVAALQDAINQTTSSFTSLTGHSFGIKLTKEFANSIKDVSGLDVAIPGVIALILNFLVLLFSTLLLVRENTLIEPKVVY